MNKYEICNYCEKLYECDNNYDKKEVEKCINKKRRQ